MNEPEIVCLCKALGQMSPTSSREQLNTMVSVARALMRVGAMDRHPAYIAEIFHLLDRMLVQALFMHARPPCVRCPTTKCSLWRYRFGEGE